MDRRPDSTRHRRSTRPHRFVARAQRQRRSHRRSRLAQSGRLQAGPQREGGVGASRVRAALRAQGPSGRAIPGLPVDRIAHGSFVDCLVQADEVLLWDDGPAGVVVNVASVVGRPSDHRLIRETQAHKCHLLLDLRHGQAGPRTAHERVLHLCEHFPRVRALPTSPPSARPKASRVRLSPFRFLSRRSWCSGVGAPRTALRPGREFGRLWAAARCHYMNPIIFHSMGMPSQ